MNNAAPTFTLDFWGGASFSCASMTEPMGRSHCHFAQHLIHLAQCGQGVFGDARIFSTSSVPRRGVRGRGFINHVVQSACIPGFACIILPADQVLSLVVV